MINNAGIGSVGTVEDNGDDEWHRVLDVNVLGVVPTCIAVLPHLRRSASPAIVNVSSMTTTAGLVDRACYSASKGAVLSLTLAVAADLLSDGIRVNCVTPGTVDTPWVGRLLARTSNPDDQRQLLERRQPMGRLGTAEEVAAAILFLAHPHASFIAGIALPVAAGCRASGRPVPDPPRATGSRSVLGRDEIEEGLPGRRENVHLAAGVVLGMSAVRHPRRDERDVARPHGPDLAVEVKFELAFENDDDLLLLVCVMRRLCVRTEEGDEVDHRPLTNRLELEAGQHLHRGDVAQTHEATLLFSGACRFAPEVIFVTSHPASLSSAIRGLDGSAMSGRPGPVRPGVSLLPSDALWSTEMPRS